MKAWLRLRQVDGEIARLAVPALGALVAEPLYVLADTAVVGHLGTPELGGLAIAAQSLLTLHALMIFLAYGTTAAVARLLGAGKERQAARQAVQSLWLAVGLGVVGVIVLWVLTDPILTLLGADGEILRNGRIYLRVSLFGFPAMLVMLAGVGYLRGLQDTLRPLLVAIFTAGLNLALELVLIYGFDQGIGASALATVVAQWLGAVLYVVWTVRAVRTHEVGLGPDLSAIAGLARVGGDLFLRTAALRGSFTVAVAVAARIDEPSLGAHEISFALWSLVALVLDALAIAGQALVGRHLGAGEVAETRATANRIVYWAVVVGVVAAALLLVLRPVVPGLFSNDPEVVALTAFLFWHLAAMQPVNGVVFALDGILIGAGDLRFLAWAMTLAAACFIPLAIGVGVADLGIGWLWGALWVLMLARLVSLTLRFRTTAWLRPGAIV